MVGWGPYNPDSMFRVRLLWHVSEAPLTAAALRHRSTGGLRDAQLSVLLQNRVQTAVQKRRRCGLPNKQVTKQTQFLSISRLGTGFSINLQRYWLPVLHLRPNHLTFSYALQLSRQARIG